MATNVMERTKWLYLWKMNFINWRFEDLGEPEQEILLAQLASFPFMGFEQEENALIASFKEGDIDLSEIVDVLENYTYQEEIVPAINWNEKWEQGFEPIVLENQVAIRAHFHAPIPQVKHEIIITPKMSFGTGHHATTQLMLQQMNQHNWTETKVLDYGTGTGVLAIYAEMLGAQKVVANDIDQWSEENARENVARNNCKNISIRLGDLDVVPEYDFDGILANINLNVLKDNMETLMSKLKKGRNGLLLSGILDIDEKDIITTIKAYSADYQVYRLDKWLAIHVKI